MDNSDIIIRLTLAIFLGGAIGLEREMKDQPAGLRTHIILCVGSALLTLISLYIYYTVDPQNADPSRITAQIVTGIGFLGAGAIMRFGVSVKGLTTAASLWTTAAIGMAVGSGFYVGALYTTFILLFVLNILHHWARKLLETKTSRRVSILVEEHRDILEEIKSIIETYGAEIVSIRFHRNRVKSSQQIVVDITTSGEFHVTGFSGEIAGIEGVSKVSIH